MVIWSARRQSPVALRAGCTCPGIVSERPAPPGSRAGRRRPSPGYAEPWRGESRSPGRGQSPGFAHSRMPPSHGPPMCASSPAIFNCRLMPDWSPSSRLKARPSAGSALAVSTSPRSIATTSSTMYVWAAPAHRPTRRGSPDSVRAAGGLPWRRLDRPPGRPGHSGFRPARGAPARVPGRRERGRATAHRRATAPSASAAPR